MKKLTIVLVLSLLCCVLRGWEEKDLETLLGHIADGMATGELVGTEEWRAIVSPGEDDIKRHGSQGGKAVGARAGAGIQVPDEGEFMKESYRTLREFMATRMMECEKAGDYDNAIQMALATLSFVKYRKPQLASLDQLVCLGGPIYRLFWNKGLSDGQRRALLDGARQRLSWQDTPETRRLFAEAEGEEARRSLGELMGFGGMPEASDARLFLQGQVVSREVILIAMEAWLEGISERAISEDGGEPVLKPVRNGDAINGLFRKSIGGLCAAYGLDGACGCSYKAKEGEFMFYLVTGEPLGFWVLDNDRVHVARKDGRNAIRP